MREDLRRPGGGRVFWSDGCSIHSRVSGKVKHWWYHTGRVNRGRGYWSRDGIRDVRQRGWRMEDGMLYQDRLHHLIHVCKVRGEHVWGRPSQTGPWSTQTASRGMRSYVTGTQWTFWCHRMVELWLQQGSGHGPETCSDRNEGTQGRQHRSGE